MEANWGTKTFFCNYIFTYILIYCYIYIWRISRTKANWEIGKKNLELNFFISFSFVLCIHMFFAFIDAFIYLGTSTREWLLRKFSAFYFLFIIHYKSVYVYFYKRI